MNVFHARFKNTGVPLSVLKWLEMTYRPTGLFSPGSGDVTSFLMTEARQHNTEIRLAVGKVTDKVDQLASKV